jgi:hypothetical protein
MFMRKLGDAPCMTSYHNPRIVMCANKRFQRVKSAEDSLFGNRLLSFAMTSERS